MLRINRSDMSAVELYELENLLTMMKGQPDQAVAAFLGATKFKDRVIVKDDAIFDAVDALAKVNQESLMAAYDHHLEAVLVYGDLSKVVINLMDGDTVKIEQDGQKRLVAHVRIELFRNKDWMEARENVRRTSDTIWRLWSQMIPESIVPIESVDATSRGGTRGTRREIPAWELRQGQIVCRRA